MPDMRLNGQGDLLVTEDGDIMLTDSIRQAVMIRLRWLLAEWRLGPDLGFPWFQQVLVKNPNLARIRSEIQRTVLSVKGVTSCRVTKVNYNRGSRRASFSFTFTVGKQTFDEEVAYDAG